jgi:hypothetical protein
MATLITKTNTQNLQHQAIHARMKYLVNAVGKFDLQTCLPHIADSKSLMNRIALYRWSLYDFKETIQRDNELDKLVFQGNSLLKSFIQENQEILEQISSAIIVAENVADDKIIREELNVILVKTNLAVNATCETIKLKMIKEDVLSKNSQNIE